MDGASYVLNELNDNWNLWRALIIVYGFQKAEGS